MNRARWILAIFGIASVLVGLAVLMSGRIDNLLISALSSWLHRPLSFHWISRIRAIGYLIAAGGVLLLLIRFLAVPRKAAPPTAARRDVRVFFFFAVMIALLWLPPILVGHSESFSGERYWWLHDDAMISMR
jgi:hypothetical protein